MHIEKLKDPNNGLDHYRMPEGYDPGSELARAADLLYALLDMSFRCSRDALETEINGHRENVQGIYWKCKGVLDQVMEHHDRAGFLAMSAIEQCWGWAKPLILCRLEDLLAPGGTAPLDQARELEAILADNPYKKLWAEKSALYVSILERIGFDPKDADFSDLTQIMDPLLDALTFYEGHSGRRPGACRYRTGPLSGSRSPAIARAMCMFTSEKEIVDAAMAAAPEALVMFAAMEKTHAQVKDYFHEWFYGYADERQRNYMRNDHLTAEEYLAMGCDYTRTVYLCVKDGGTVWLMGMPFKGDMYSRVGNEGSDYYYGKRASYAPYQIFYKMAAAPKAPEGTSMLAVKKDAWMLNDLLDKLSMAWFPAFMDETVRHFFRDRDMQSVDLLLPEEAAAAYPGQTGTESYAVVPVHSGVPAVCSWRYEIKEPADMFQEPYLRELFDYFKVTPKDLDGVPILPNKTGDALSWQEFADGKARDAYIRILGGRIAAFMEGRWNARDWILARADARCGEIIKAAGEGDLMAFMDVIIDGTPVLNPDGTQKTVRADRYPYAEKPAVQHTEASDARDETGRRTLGNRVWWASEHMSGRPAVVWKLRPSQPEHYAALAGCGVKELPEVLRLSGLILEFNKAWQPKLPDDLSSQYVARGYNCERKQSTWFPCLCPVNVCMRKKALQQFPYFHTEKTKK